MEKVVIGLDAYNKIMHYVNKTNFEISGLGNVQIIDGIATVTDIYLLKQENTPSETELDADSINKVLFEHYKSKKPGEIKFWWHSHVDMGVFWSTTDLQAMEQLTKNGWFIHAVFNKKNEVKVCYTNNEPFSVKIDDLELEIDDTLVSKEKLKYLLKIQEIDNKNIEIYDKDYESLVSEKSYTAPVNYYNQNSKHDYGKTFRWGDTWDNDDDFPALSSHYSSNVREYNYWGDQKKEEVNNPSNYNFSDIQDIAEIMAYGFDQSDIPALNSIGIYTEEDLIEADDFNIIYNAIDKFNIKKGVM